MTSLLMPSPAKADGDTGFPTISPTPSAVRLPWTRGEVRFQRQWLLLAQRPSNGAAEIDPAVEPTPGQPAQFIGGAVGPAWIPSTSWSDTLDLSGNLSPTSEVPMDGVAADAVGYASTTVTVDHEGPWDLSIGVDGKIEVWVNGAAVSTPTGPFEFQRESTRVRVQFKAGANRVLLRLTHNRSPWMLALRAVAPGAVLSDGDEIAPAVVSRADSKDLLVRTHPQADPKGAPVLIQVIAAGGKVIAAANGARGETVQLPITGWAEGAYELRCTTKTAWNQSFVTYLPWYHGDSLNAVRRLNAAAAKAAPGPAGATVKMLAELVHDRLGAGSAVEATTVETAMKVHSPLLEFEELEQLAGGGLGPVHGGGFVRLAYTDPVDGSVQYARAYLPPDYEASRRWPLIVYLHGFNPDNPAYERWWSVDQRHSNVADRHRTIVVEVHGRGNAQYVGIGEEDVLRALKEAKARLSVDEDRVYLTGESMGGHGTWFVASRHPDLFAAIAPVYGGWDFRLSDVSGSGPALSSARNAREAFLQDTVGSFTSAENLLNVPIYVQHGDVDHSVSVAHSRHIVGMLQRWGYTVRYREHVGRGHEDLGVREEIADWLLPHRREAAPKRVRVRAADLRSAGNYWLRVDAFEQPSTLIVADAEMIRPGTLRLDTINAATVSLQLPEILQSADRTLTVVWNGVSRTVPAEGGRATIMLGQKADGGLKKRAGLEGPLSDLIRTPFLVVVGTCSSDPVMRDYCAKKAEVFRDLWQQWQHHAPRVKKDSEVTAADEKAYSLLLIGGPEANLVARRLGKTFPLEVSADQVTIEGKTWSVKDGYVQMIYPSPFQSDRYVMVVAGTSASGLYFWRPGLWAIPHGYPTNRWDWVIQDGRRVSLTPEQRAHDGWIASGVFDAQWKRTDQWTTQGNAELRAASFLRRPPETGVSAPTALLAGIAGRYELFPGVNLSVVTRDGQAFVVFPGSPEIPMTFVRETEFMWSETMGEAIFQRGPGGIATSIKLYLDGVEYTVKRVP